MAANLKELAARYKADPESVYNSWFIENEERMKAFRSIRRGVIDVIESIKTGSFGNNFKGSPPEFVLSCITEQKQVFQGAAHPFYWKPKLRIPDIYENEANKIAFGRFLENCLATTSSERLAREILSLDECRIKGLGPAVGNILYFLHPTQMPPFNTAMLNGFKHGLPRQQKARFVDGLPRNAGDPAADQRGTKPRAFQGSGGDMRITFRCGCGEDRSAREFPGGT